MAALSISGSMAEEVVEALARDEGNTRCADCGRTAPKWASINLGVVLCIDCCGMHRMLGTHISKVRSLELDRLLPEHVVALAQKGNTKANAELEQVVPVAYHHCQPRDPPGLREQWVRAKYERKEFENTESAAQLRQAALSGLKSGTLSKKGKANTKWSDRMFRLNQQGLAYFTSDKHYPHAPKRVMSLKSAKICVSSTFQAKNSFQFVESKVDGPVPPSQAFRVIYVSADSSKDMFDWVNAFRAAKAKALGFEVDEKDPARRKEAELALKEGYEFDGMLKKQSPRETGWNTRWFALLDRVLLYFRRPSDPSPVGYIPLGHASKGYKVELVDGLPTGCCLLLTTPFRKYPLQAEADDIARQWVDVLRQAIERSDDELPIPMRRMSTVPHDEEHSEEEHATDDSEDEASARGSLASISSVDTVTAEQQDAGTAQ